MSIIDSLKTLTQKMNCDLQKNILPFWMQAVDEEHGGFLGAMGIDGVPIADSPKSLVLNARILWTFSSAYRIYGNTEYLQAAERAFDYLTHYFWDIISGGGYWQLKTDASVGNDLKITYAQGFLLYAFSEYAQATNKQEAYEWAEKTYKFIENNCRRGKFYTETANGSEVSRNGTEGMGSNGRMSMNTYLHIIESVTNYFRIQHNSETEETLVNLIEVVTELIYNEKTKHCDLFFDKEMKPISSNVSYGHDIESSWLIAEAGETLSLYAKNTKRSSELLDRCKGIAVEMAEAVYNEGLDPSNGSVYNEGNCEGVIISPVKVWWAQAEGIVGFVNAWQISGDEKYIEISKKLWNYIEKNILNPKGKEWLATGLDSESDENTPYLINPWKCPYHNSRAAFEIHQRVRILLES